MNMSARRALVTYECYLDVSLIDDSVGRRYWWTRRTVQGHSDWGQRSWPRCAQQLWEVCEHDGAGTRYPCWQNASTSSLFCWLRMI